jgi:hypothetical protein
MRKKETTGKSNRKTYSKPQLEKVQLVVEEAVLTGCKTSSSGNEGKCHPKNIVACIRSGARS